MPFLGPGLAPNQPWTWNYTVSPQTALNNRTFAYPRGKVLGGSSSVSEYYILPLKGLFTDSIIIDYMVYNRGGKDDYDRWANYTGDQGWSWDAMQVYMKKVWLSPFSYILFYC